MIDPRIYRLAFAPALLAFVALMFSLQGMPEELEPAVPPAFEGGRAAALAREIVAVGPERPPGSETDAEVAELVAERLGEVEAGVVSEQEVTASFGGEEVSGRNIVLSLPGESTTTVVVLAGRDAATEAAAAQSAAATAGLVELAAGLAVSSHEKTFVLASTAAAPAGAEGARRLIDGLPDPSEVEALIVLSQPAVGQPSPPFVVTGATGARRPAVQLTETAATAVSEQLGLAGSRPAIFTQLARLAIPAGLGEQAPLIGDGLDAVGLSSAGERPVSEPATAEVSRRVLERFGRAASAIVHAIDVAEGPLEHGPEPYVVAGDNLIPGWPLALLALALLLPALVAAVEATGWTLRRSRGLGPALGRVATWAAAPVAALLALYALGLVGVVPRPGFPFDPAAHEPGAGAVVAIVLIAAAAGGALLAATRARGRAAASRPALIAAVGAVTVAAAALVWLANPYLGLLIAPATHPWIAAAVGARRPLVGLAAAASAAPLVLALAAVAGALDLGAEAPWTLAVMLATGQIPFAVAMPLAVLAGSLAAAPAAARRDPEPT